VLHPSTRIPSGSSSDLPNLNLGQKSDPWHEYGRSQRYATTLEYLIRDLVYVGQTFFSHFFTNEIPDIHHEFARIATDLTIKYPVIETFRRSAKSTYFANFLPVWHTYCEPFVRAGIFPKTRAETLAFLKEAPNIYIVVLSMSASQAKARLRTYKRVHGAEYHADAQKGRLQLVAHFGTPVLGKSTENEIHTNRGIYASLGAGQQAHGLIEENIRPTLSIVDDPETEKNTLSEEATGKNYDNIINGVKNGLDDLGRMCVLATPIRPHSFVRRCKSLADAEAKLRREGAKDLPGWYYFYHPLIVDEAGEPPDRIPTYDEYKAETIKTVFSVWEDKRPILKELRALEVDKAAGKSKGWYQSRQCQLRSDESNNKFKESSIQLYDGRYFQEGKAWFLEITHLGPYTELAQGSPYLLDKPQVVPVNLYTGMDDSQGVKRDYAVKLTRAYDGKRHFIHSIIRSNSIGPEGQVLWLVHGHEGQPGYLKLREKAIVVEKVFLKNAMERVLREMGRELGVYIPIVASPPKSAKAEKYRASSIYSDFHSRLVYFRKEHRRSITTFTNYDATIEHQPDDDIDAYELSRQRNYAPRHTTATKPTIVERRSRVSRSALESWKLPRTYTS